LKDNNIRELLIEFKSITEDIIKDIDNEVHENIDKLFIKRQEIIDKIDSIQFIKEEFGGICNDLKILSVNRCLEELFEKKKIDIKDEMNKLNSQRMANKSYTQSSNVRRSFFSTKI
jgi:hypothetical protein